MYTSINNYKRVEKLVNLTKLIDYGLMPTQDYARSEDEGVPMIRVTNIKSDGSIDMSDVKYIKTDTPRLDEKRVKTGDILMVQCGSTTGKVAMVPSECDGYTFGSFSFVIRADDGILTQDYLFEVLSSELVQRQIRHTWNVVTVRPNTSKPNVQNLLIPVPSKAKQVEIAQKCASMRSSIHSKRKTADTGVENARDEVERMILGRE
ncbi:MAG: restriction endonuclease subunit S [Candidatus Dojkabacteria bacterium]|nr:restriction endonuclease subunit S [Candidatus Dojkabacteria bacterium]